MSSTVLVAFATRYGSTREVALAVSRGLSRESTDAEVVPVRRVKSLQGCAAVVLGAPLFLGSMEREAAV